jgi:hypothetical protein
MGHIALTKRPEGSRQSISTASETTYKKALNLSYYAQVYFRRLTVLATGLLAEQFVTYLFRKIYGIDPRSSMIL